jgi:hypothetical protein
MAAERPRITRPVKMIARKPLPQLEADQQRSIED